MCIIKRIDDSISNPNSNPILQKWCTCKKQKNKKKKKKVERKRTHNLTKYREREQERQKYGRRESTQSQPNRQKFTIFQFGTVTGERESLYR